MPRKFLKQKNGPKGRYPRNTKKMRTTDEEGHPVALKGMKKPYRYASRYGCAQGDHNFSVIRRFLISRKGQLWNHVYSEICAEADSRSFSGHELREWLDYLVERNCFIDEDGDIRDEHSHLVGRWWGEFFVHPETKILEYIQPVPCKKFETPKTVFELNGTLYHEHKGIWYRVRMKEVPQKRPWYYDLRYLWDDVLIEDTLKTQTYSYGVIRQLRAKYGHSPRNRPWFCEWKQSANKNEIAKLKKKHRLAV